MGHGVLRVKIMTNRRPTRNPRRLRSPAALLAAWALLTPLMMGGCQDFQDEAVTALETATSGIIDAAVSNFFDQFQSGGGN